MLCPSMISGLMMRRRIETANTQRRRCLVRVLLVGVSSTALTWWWCNVVVENMRALGPVISDTTVVAVAGLLIGVGAVIILVMVLRQPNHLVARPRMRFRTTSARRVVSRIRRHWVTICRQAGVSVEQRTASRTVVHVPRVLSLRPCALGVEAAVSTVAGAPPSQLVDRAPHLSSALGVPCRIEPTGPSTARLTAVLESPLDEVTRIDRFPDLELERMSVMFGTREDALPAEWPWKEKSGAVVGGEPGGGKTVAATVLCGPLLISDYANVHIVDGKGGRDWSWAKSRASAFTNDAMNFEAVAELVERFESRMLSRLADGPEAGEASNFWTRPRTLNEPFELLVIDECQTYLNASGRSSEVKKLVLKISASVENVVRKGRSAGCAVLLMSQKPTADSIPTAIRDNAGLRMAFKVNTRAAEEAVLGELPEATDEHLRAVNIRRVGCAVINDETGKRILLRSAYIDEATAYARLSEALGDQKEEVK